MKNLIPYNLFELAKYSEENIKNLVKNFLEFVYAPAQQSEFKKIYTRFDKKYNAISFGNDGFNVEKFDRNFDLPTGYVNLIFSLNTRIIYDWLGSTVASAELSFFEEEINLDLRKNKFKELTLSENDEIKLLKKYPYYKLENPNKFFDEIIKQINFFL